MKLCLKPIIFTILLASLFACGSTKDTTEPPAELVSFVPEAKIKTVWTSDTGKGSDKYQFLLTPYISGNSIYTVDYKGLLSSFNKTSGKLIWKNDTNMPISTGVGGSTDLLFVGTRDGRMAAFYKSSGAQAWVTNLSSEMLSAPTRGLGVVVVRTVDGNIQAFSDVTGEKLWSYKQSVPALSLRGTSSPVISGGSVISGSDNGQITALSLLEGRIVWETRVAVPVGRSEWDLERMVDVDGTPLVDRGILYVGAYQGRVAALTTDQGQILWARDKSVHLGITMDNENLYAVDEVSHTWALDRNTGATVWIQDKLHARPLTAPVVYRGFVLMGDFEGYIHALASEDGRLIARMQTNNSGVMVPPVVDGDVFYVLNRDGKLSALTIVGQSG